MTTKTCRPPGPPPPPPSRGNKPLRVLSPPRPQHAAVPFMCDARLPVQETGDQGDDSHNFQNTNAPLQHTDNSTPPPPPGEEDTETDEGKKQHPVQETDPPPQAYENPQPAETPNPEGNVSTMDEDDDIQH
ncbi:PREDICTED: circumsporozoite protein-like isoform X2 [Poecilia mexicana]|uniref:circumsporozoite protein-like isoform X2 n=1 Tax=Poecilia mexicana TaxID=48701 RepID=UPI00072DFC83|nr:PREDICTED: circumsporozoite protein-like isoform X2 [Poecilia mexicana]XP_016526761.1 PREDICTED: circumsporozoite protein-like isoform X2 [Poecilia formosa]